MATTKQANQQANQTDGEFFAVISTGRQGLQDALTTMDGELRRVAAPNVQGHMDAWKQKALLMVTSSDELRPLFGTRKGLYSIYQSLARAAQLGLQPGGHYPHFHLVKFGDRCELIPSAEGLAFAATHGPGSVLRSIPTIMEVHENDDLMIDQAAGRIEHRFDPRADRGDLVGYATKLEYRDGHTEIPYVSIDDVEHIRQNYSNSNSPAWKKSGRDMRRKIATKKLLRKAASEAEGLSSLYDVESVVDTAPAPPRDVTERASARLDAAIDAAGPPQDEPTPAEAPTSEQGQEETAWPSVTDAAPENDLF